MFFLILIHYLILELNFCNELHILTVDRLERD